MQFLRKLLKFIFQLNPEEPSQRDISTEVVPSPPILTPNIEQEPVHVEEIIEQDVPPTIPKPTDIPELSSIDPPAPDFVSLLEKALDKNFSKKQRTAIESIRQVLTELGITDPRYIAYIFATAWHESKLKPVKERRARLNTKLRKLQDRYWESGYYGRGFVQITWEYNYAKFDELLNINLLEEPDLALQTDTAAKILTLGMRDGLFTGVKLSQFFNDSRTDWLKARRIVNGNDQAELIGQYGELIYQEINTPES